MGGVLDLFIVTLVTASYSPSTRDCAPNRLRSNGRNVYFINGCARAIRIRPKVASFSLALAHSLASTTNAISIAIVGGRRGVFMYPSAMSFTTKRGATGLAIRAPSTTRNVACGLRLTLDNGSIDGCSSKCRRVSMGFTVLG